jgi:hypothetical protein
MRGGLGEIVTDVNQRFTEDVERSGRFMTLFLAWIDRQKKISNGKRSDVDLIVSADSKSTQTAD